MEENRLSGRIQNFKNMGKSAEEMRRRRTTVSVELRKANRDDQMMKRRNVDVSEPLSPVNDNNVPISLTIPEIIAVFHENDTARMFDAVSSARKILSKERNPPIDELIKAGLVPKLISFLTPQFKSNTRLQFEACWAITNIASGTAEQTQVIIKEGAVPKLVDLLHSEDPVVAEQATWALGNIAGDGSKARDLVLSNHAMDALLSLAKADLTVNCLRNIVWTISNLCRNKNPPPPFEHVRKCLPALRQFLEYTDSSIISDTCWALSYLTDGSDEQIQSVVEAGVLPSLVKLLGTDQTVVLVPALRSVGNVVTGNEELTNAVLKENVLSHLKKLLYNSRPNIVKEASWTISNITAGTEPQIQAVIDADILPSIINVLRTGDYKAQKEAAFAITNLTSNATLPQLAVLLQSNCLPPFCQLLGSKDQRVVQVVLDGIQNLLHKAESVGEVDKVALLIEECGGLDKLEALQNHETQKVYEKAYSIIEAFFSSEVGEETDLAPIKGEDVYQFNPSNPNGDFNF